jgi:DtxR family Mn-dependent transcriptional regulator
MERDMTGQVVLTSAAEEYLEAIHRFGVNAEEPSTGLLARQLKVRPASVTGMLKRLADMGLITYKPYGRFSLTPAGERRAHEIIRRHRLAERLLTDILDVPLDEVHDAACRLEHVLSPDLEKRIAQKLGDPELCPHGNPIDASAEDGTIALTDAAPGRLVTIVRLDEESPDVVRYLAERHLLPGSRVKVSAREPLGDAVVLEVDGETHTLGRRLAATIRVKLSARGRRR